MGNRFGKKRVPQCYCDTNLTCGPCLKDAVVTVPAVFGGESQPLKGKALMPIPNLYHVHDPALPADAAEQWGYVYLHGEAEAVNDRMQQANDWEWYAPDMFVSDQPMPTSPGEYEVRLYGNRAFAVLAMPEPRDWLCGRVALETDERALKHVRTPEDWR